MQDESMLWLQLRERRYSLPRNSSLLQGSSSRVGTLAAAMQQFEEQMAAAKAVTPATRPLNLYYGLVQAGLAITAVHEPGTFTFSGHGLMLGDTRPDLPEIFVQPNGQGAFQRVSAAINSEAIDGPVSLDTLWESLPELCDGAPLRDSSQLSALFVIPTHQPSTVRSMIINGENVLLPDPTPSPMRAHVFIPAQPPDAADWRTWATDLFSHYPSLGNWTLPAGEASEFELLSAKRSNVTIEWPNPKPSGTLSDKEQDVFYDGIAPEYRYRRDRYLRPSIEASGKKPPPSPLMTWWLLLYSFSMLARYQPRKWVDLLNYDRSPHATHLQYAMDSALTAIPQLVLGALDGKVPLLSRPMTFT